MDIFTLLLVAGLSFALGHMVGNSRIGSDKLNKYFVKGYDTALQHIIFEATRESEKQNENENIDKNR